MPSTADNVDIILPGESGLAIASPNDLVGSDVMWLGQGGGTVPKTVTLAQLKQYFQQGASGIHGQGLFFPAAGDGLAYIVSDTKPTARPSGIVPSGITTNLAPGDRWYDSVRNEEWIWRGSYWVSPVKTVTLMPIATAWGSYQYWNPGFLVWISTLWWDAAADGLECWLHNEEATAILLEQMVVTYFVGTASLTGGWKYTCWVENVAAAMSPSVYYQEPNTSEAMTLAVDPSGISRGQANVRVKTALQTINWNPYSSTNTNSYYQRTRSNTVYYRRQLLVNSNHVRVFSKDYQIIYGSGGTAPPDIMLGATLHYRWVR